MNLENGFDWEQSLADLEERAIDEGAEVVVSILDSLIKEINEIDPVRLLQIKVVDGIEHFSRNGVDSPFSSEETKVQIAKYYKLQSMSELKTARNNFSKAVKREAKAKREAEMATVAKAEAEFLSKQEAESTDEDRENEEVTSLQDSVVGETSTLNVKRIVFTGSKAQALRLIKELFDSGFFSNTEKELQSFFEVGGQPLEKMNRGTAHRSMKIMKHPPIGHPTLNVIPENLKRARKETQMSDQETGNQ